MKIWNLCIYWRCTSKNFPGEYDACTAFICFWWWCWSLLFMYPIHSNTAKPWSIWWDTHGYPFHLWTNLGPEISESPFNAPKIHRDIHLDHPPPKKKTQFAAAKIRTFQPNSVHPSILVHPNFTGRWWLQTLRKTERTVPWIAIFTTQPSASWGESKGGTARVLLKSKKCLLNSWTIHEMENMLGRSIQKTVGTWWLHIACMMEM